MVYNLSESTIYVNGHIVHNTYLFEDKEKALAGLKNRADIILDGYNKGFVKLSWLELDIMIPDIKCNTGELDGELIIDGEPFALQYIDPDNFDKSYHRRGIND